MNGRSPPPPVALTIAGSDPSGGAGVQADLRTFAAYRVYGCSVLTAVTVQNTRGVLGYTALAPELVAAQLEAVLADLPVRAVKTGMLPGPATVRAVTRRAAAGALPNLVVDPVLTATSGLQLSDVDNIRLYRDGLFRYASVVTPNLAEAGALLGRPVRTAADMARAATELAGTGARCVVVKGGHLPGDRSVDVVWHQGRLAELPAPRIDTANTHGTGCAFAAAIAAGLAVGLPTPAALAGAKNYLTRALAAAAHWRLGAGHGPPDLLTAPDLSTVYMPESVDRAGNE